MSSRAIENQAKSLLWTERYPLVAFFTLTFFISWTLWLLQPVVKRFDPACGNLFGLFAPFGPSLAAIVLSFVGKPNQVPAVPWRSRLLFPALALLASLWVTWDVLAQIPSSRIPVLTGFLWFMLNLLPAWMFFLAGLRNAGIRSLLHSLTTWRTRLIWWLAALGLIGSSYLIAYAILRVFGQTIPAFPRTESLTQLLRLMPFVFLSTFLYGGAMGEESGWRGFALPRLQHHFDPLRSSIILGVIWGVWHFPLHFQGFYDKLEVFTPNLIFALLMRVGSGISLGIVFTWLYNRSHGNLLLMVVLHTATNLSTGWLLPLGAGVYVGTILLAVTLAMLDRMWLKLEPLATACLEPPASVTIP
jgi:membrane protease YdiL (CAAX protease family)